MRAITLIMMMAALTGCAVSRSDPAKATRAYPAALHGTQIADMQVFRKGASLEIVNATARGYEQFDLWLNQRYVRRVESLPAGATLELSLWEFYDELGETLNAGGLWRTDPPTPLRLVEIQVDEQSPMVGLVTIPADADRGRRYR